MGELVQLQREPQEFKARAECARDIAEFIQAVYVLKMSYEDMEPFVGVEVTFTTRDTLEQMREALAGIADMHVFLETLRPIAEYTGKRIWEE